MNLIDYLPRLNLQIVEFLKKIITPDSLIFETGSGNSTIWFGKQAKKVVTLEDDEDWYKKIQKLIKKEKLWNVKIYFDPDYPKKQFGDILQNEDIIEYDIVLHDGPSKVKSRIEAMKFIHHFVKAGGYLIVDDANQRTRGTRRYLDILGWEKSIILPECDASGARESAIVYRRPR